VFPLSVTRIGRNMSVKPVRGQRTQSIKSIPAPRRGWIQNENIAKHKDEGAAILDNWFPTSTGIRVRKGASRYATVGAGTPISALMPYRSGTLNKLFAATDAAIYDISTVVDANVSPTPIVTGQTSGDWSYTMFTTSGGTFLAMVNGANARQIYNGTAFVTTPAITGGPGTNGSQFSHVWAFKERLFYIQKDTLNVWYHAVDSIGGAVSQFSLNGVFKLGGALLFGSTWSFESTGGGLADSCVFVTTEGEVAVYEGSNPGASNWTLKGIYRVGRPLGKKAQFKAGGDLIIATDVGMIPVSSALARDQAALSEAAVSYPIEEAWKAEVLTRRAQYSWNVEIWPTQQMCIVGMPSYGELSDQCFVINIRTGAWARYTNWNCHSTALYGDRFFFGTDDGRVLEAETGSTDDGNIYTASYVGLFEDLGAAGILKSVQLARVNLLSVYPIQPQIFVCNDFVATVPLPPSAAAAIPNASVWDTLLWDSGTWATETAKLNVTQWQSVNGFGYSIAPGVQITIGGNVEPKIDLVQVDLSYERGGAIA
jgi:hypothetical protein